MGFWSGECAGLRWLITCNSVFAKLQGVLGATLQPILDLSNNLSDNEHKHDSLKWRSRLSTRFCSSHPQSNIDDACLNSASFSHVRYVELVYFKKLCYVQMLPETVSKKLMRAHTIVNLRAINMSCLLWKIKVSITQTRQAIVILRRAGYFQPHLVGCADQKWPISKLQLLMIWILVITL